MVISSAPGQIEPCRYICGCKCEVGKEGMVESSGQYACPRLTNATILQRVPCFVQTRDCSTRKRPSATTNTLFKTSHFPQPKHISTRFALIWSTEEGRIERNRSYRIGECDGPSEVDIDRLQDQANTLASKHCLYVLFSTECVS
ncbi:hypothetical protein SCLCIDRAFT_1013103 [Scleroderma citrinum Foug A]|uniref:Uncharacterized protein n=1 Tax=Scleroderma citrinum Foug A TaxID=1036808 RepID=A0A0C3A3K0_9AGAM|nr:hypothetical protein SCLCIDRAFT_1013103 [Scleroderma citrinum Foug A]